MARRPKTVERQRALELWAEGSLPQAEIAVAVGVSVAAVKKWIAVAKAEKGLIPSKKEGLETEETYAEARRRKMVTDANMAVLKHDLLKGTLIERRLVNVAFQELRSRVTAIRKDLRRKGDTIGYACLESGFRGFDDAVAAILEGREIRGGEK